MAKDKKIDARFLKSLEGTLPPIVEVKKGKNKGQIRRQRAAYWNGSFGVYHEVSGTLTFYMKYGPARTDYRLGRYPEMNVSQALQAFKDRAAEVRLGGDPAADRKAKKQMPTLASLWADYQETDRYLRLSKGRQNNFIYTIKHLSPLPVWNRPVDEIEVEDAQAAITRIARKEEGRTAAIKAKQICGQLWRWGQAKRRVKVLNPFAEADTPAERNRKGHVLKPEQYRELIDWLEQVETDPTVSLQRQQAALCLQALIYSGRRRNQIRDLRTEHLNLRHGWAWISDKSLGEDRLILGDRLRDVIERAMTKRGEASGWLFPKLHTRNDESSMVNDLFEHARVACDLYYEKPVPTGIERIALTVHDLRRSFNATARRIKIDGELRRALLGHAAKDINEGVYAGDMDEELRGAANQICAAIVASPTKQAQAA